MRVAISILVLVSPFVIIGSCVRGRSGRTGVLRDRGVVIGGLCLGLVIVVFEVVVADASIGIAVRREVGHVGSGCGLL